MEPFAYGSALVTRIFLGASDLGRDYAMTGDPCPAISTSIDNGMAPGAGMTFLLAGGITSIPAAMAVWALARLASAADFEDPLAPPVSAAETPVWGPGAPP